MKQFIKYTLIVIVLFVGYVTISSNHTFATAEESLPFYEGQITETNEDNLDIAGNIKRNDLTENTSTFAKIRDFFGMEKYTANQEKAPALAYVKMIINRLLGLVSLISLIMVIMAFYMIFFSKQEESLGKAKKILMRVAIALIVMGLSRYIVTYFYDMYNVATTNI